MHTTISNCRMLGNGPTYFSFEDISGSYGSRTGAVDLWVLPKPPSPVLHHPCRE
jgi:hypothetical protein